MQVDDGWRVPRPASHRGTTDTGAGRSRSRGQALVEFALVIPVVAFIFLGVVDMSRVFTSMLAVASMFLSFNAWTKLRSNSTRYVGFDVAATTSTLSMSLRCRFGDCHESVSDVVEQPVTNRTRTGSFFIVGIAVGGAEV